jgi:hypothetical protein
MWHSAASRNQKPYRGSARMFADFVRFTATYLSKNIAVLN